MFGRPASERPCPAQRPHSRGRAGSDPVLPDRKVGSIEWKPHLSFGCVDLVMLGGGTKTPPSSGANILPLRRAAPSLSLSNAGRPSTAHGNGNPVAGQACRDPRSGSIDTPASRRTRRTVEYAADRNLGRPDGLRAGSPPSPSPRSIRLTVRRLPRSPRLSGPGPHCSHSAADLASPKLSIPAIDWNSDRYSGRCCVNQRTIRPLASNFRT